MDNERIGIHVPVKEIEFYFERRNKNMSTKQEYGKIL